MFLKFTSVIIIQGNNGEDKKEEYIKYDHEVIITENTYEKHEDISRKYSYPIEGG